MKNLFRLFTRDRAAPIEPVGQAVGDLAASSALLESLLGMAWVVEARDPCTGGHLWRVPRYAALLCERSGTSRTVCARVSIGAFLHDLGKVGIPDAVLRKPSALDDDERAVIQTHPELGARLLAGHPLAHWAADAVRSHHERPDGHGYPQGLFGNAIPHAALVVGICDAFDAMTSTRPYRSGMPVAQALEAIHRDLGRQFGEPLARHFLALGVRGSARPHCRPQRRWHSAAELHDLRADPGAPARTGAGRQGLLPQLRGRVPRRCVSGRSARCRRADRAPGIGSEPGTCRRCSAHRAVRARHRSGCIRHLRPRLILAPEVLCTHPRGPAM